MPFSRPGTYVSEVQTLGTVLPDTPNVAVTCFVERCNQGPVNTPTSVSSWNEFVSLFGGFTDTTLYLPYAVWQYFNNGGAQCYVTRVLGTGAAVATINLGDRVATPQNTLSVTAKNPGTWGNNLRVQALDRGADRFDLLVYNGAANDANKVETWLDLSMDLADQRYVVSVLNSVTSGSRYIVVADLNSTSPAPNDRPALATKQLAAGANGTAVSGTDYSAAVSSLNELVSQAININIPGNSTSAVLTSAITYCEQRGDAFLVIDPSPNLTTASAVSEASAFAQSSYAAYYYPWLQALDAGSPTAGATKLLPPGGAVCGVICRTDLQAGAYKAPAGLHARLSGVVALERKLASTDLDTLNDSYINAIRQHPVGGIVVYGARTLSRTSATRYVSVRRSLNYVKDNVKKLCEFAVFENNNATTWSMVTTRIANFLTQYWQAGGLNGRSTQEAFYIVCNASNNTAPTIAAGELHVEVGVAVLSPAEFVVIKIGQFDGGATTFEET